MKRKEYSSNKEKYRLLSETTEKKLKALNKIEKHSFLKNPFKRIKEEYERFKVKRELKQYKKQYEKFKNLEEKEKEKKDKIKDYYSKKEKLREENEEREKRKKKIKEEMEKEMIREDLERKKDKFEEIREEKDAVKEQERAALDEFREMYEDKKHGAGSGSIKEMISDLMGKLGGSESEFWRAFNYFKYNHAGVYTSDEMLLIAAEVSKNKFSTMEEMADYIENNWTKNDYIAGLDEFDKL